MVLLTDTALSVQCFITHVDHALYGEEFQPRRQVQSAPLDHIVRCVKLAFTITTLTNYHITGNLIRCIIVKLCVVPVEAAGNQNQAEKNRGMMQ